MKYFFTLVFFAFCFNSFALPVDGSKAYSVAKSFFVEKEINFVADAKVRGDLESQKSPYYIFNVSDNGGYIIVSGDDRFPMVLGYSNTGCLDEANIPEALKCVLDNYSSLIKSDSVPNDLYCSRAKVIENAAPVVAPLLTSTWGQNSPYNRLCPTIDGKRCVVGCVATAISQIMYYWKWPKKGNGSLSYVCEGVGKLYDSFEENVYDWDAIKPTTEENMSSETSMNAVSRLCYDCGVASRMSYGVKSSGTYSQYLVEALRMFMGYKASTLDILYRDCFASQKEWEDVVKRELDSGRPILFSGVSMSSSGASGHAFVIDGYDVNGYAHVNWGWEGSSDGFFNISLLNASSNYSFSENQEMIVGIEPDYDGVDNNATYQVRMRLEGAPACVGSSKGKKLGSNISFDVPRMLNPAPYIVEWGVRVGLYSSDGRYIGNVKKINLMEEESDTIALGGFYYHNSFSSYISIPDTLPDGDYYVRMLFKQKGFDTWILPEVVGGESLNYIPLYISGGRVYMNQVSTGVTDFVCDDVEVISRDYFTLSGTKLTVLSNEGVVIERSTYSDGSVKTRKVVK